MIVVSPRMYRNLEAHAAGQTRPLDRARYNRTRIALGHRRRRRDRREAHAVGKTVLRYFRDAWRGLYTDQIRTDSAVAALDADAYCLSWTVIGPALDPDVAAIFWGAS